MAYNPNWFGKTPRILLEDPLLGNVDKVIYSYLATYAITSPVATVKVGDIVTGLRVHRNTVRLSIRKLAECGHLEIMKESIEGHDRVYQVKLNRAESNGSGKFRPKPDNDNGDYDDD